MCCFEKCLVGDEISMMESIQFDLRTIESATNSFSDGNKIGQGGFGSVYKVRDQYILIYKIQCEQSN